MTAAVFSPDTRAEILALGQLHDQQQFGGDPIVREGFADQEQVTSRLAGLKTRWTRSRLSVRLAFLGRGGRSRGIPDIDDDLPGAVCLLAPDVDITFFHRPELAVRAGHG